MEHHKAAEGIAERVAEGHPVVIVVCEPGRTAAVPCAASHRRPGEQSRKGRRVHSRGYKFPWQTGCAAPYNRHNPARTSRGDCKDQKSPIDSSAPDSR